ncbi:hypothetical protein JXD20_03065 [Candidatus Peregrinibacteria bacterium]|nr:hypothetical protein [Candidatus Peregrinibacteria bacterium]
MKKKIINLLKWCFLIGVLVIPVFIIFYGGSSIEKILENKDSITVLGNGKYEIGIFPKIGDSIDNRIALEDLRSGIMKVLVGEIERYTIKDSSIYMIGDYGDGSATNMEGIQIDPSDYYDFETGELKFYRPNDPVAHYIILNFETDELKKYVDWEDVPEEDQEIFQQAKVQEEGLNVMK